MSLHEESAFAKYVETPNGPAILIGGNVIEVAVPPDVNKAEIVDILTRACRRAAQGQSGILSSGGAVVGIAGEARTTS